MYNNFWNGFIVTKLEWLTLTEVIVQLGHTCRDAGSIYPFKLIIFNDCVQTVESDPVPCDVMQIYDNNTWNLVDLNGMALSIPNQN